MSTPPPKILPETLVVVADGGKALLLRNEGDATDLNLRVEKVFELENPASREQGTDRPGRMADSGGRGRSAMEQVDWHQQEEDRFVVELAEKLYQLSHAGKIQRLVLIAPPAVLGLLRRTLHTEVTQRLAGEIAKDLTSHPVAAIEKLLAS